MIAVSGSTGAVGGQVARLLALAAGYSDTENIRRALDRADTISLGRAAELLTEVTGREIRFHDESMEEARASRARGAMAS